MLNVHDMIYNVCMSTAKYTIKQCILNIRCYKTSLNRPYQKHHPMGISTKPLLYKYHIHSPKDVVTLASKH